MGLLRSTAPVTKKDPTPDEEGNPLAIGIEGLHDGSFKITVGDDVQYVTKEQLLAVLQHAYNNGDADLRAKVAELKSQWAN
jgi:hypothetical protein